MTEASTGSGEFDDILDVEVPALMDAMRVDRALSMLTGMSRAEASALLASGVVTIDGASVSKGSTPLVGGARLEAVLPAPDSGRVDPEPDVDVAVLYEDQDLLVVDKGFDQVVHPGAGNARGTLVAGIVARFPDVGALPEQGYGDPMRPGIVHRLDKGTSGALVVARSPRAFESLSAQMSTHAASRRYVGVVEGHVEEERGIVDAPIGRSASSPTKMVVRPDGRVARTHFEVIGRVASPDRTTIGVELETGRTHQIRVHMAAIGHPIANDPRYGQRNVTSLDRDRLALHAGRLAFVHPATDQLVSFQAPIPADLVALGVGEAASNWLAEGRD